MTPNQSAINLLQDYVRELYERGQRANHICRGRVASYQTEGQRQFHCGIAEGYREALSSLINLARTFDIYDDIESLQKVDLDTLLF